MSAIQDIEREKNKTIERLAAENERLKEIIFSVCIELKKDNSIQQRRAASRKYRQMIEGTKK